MTRKIIHKKICPSCKKDTIDLFIGGQTGNYQCKCGYVGPIVLEVEKIRKARRKKKSRKKKSYR